MYAYSVKRENSKRSTIVVFAINTNGRAKEGIKAIGKRRRLLVVDQDIQFFSEVTHATVS